ncbi:MAG: coenzyme F420-0:L-glutamate ligase [Promethearchaeota archaeon]
MMMKKKGIEIFPITGFPLIMQGDDIPFLILSELKESEMTLQAGDIVVITHSIISISEGKIYQVDKIEASERAKKISLNMGISAEKAEVALREAAEVLRETPVLITRTKHGIITDLSGIDESNAPQGAVVALPDDPDQSARKISESLSRSFAFNVPVIITDTQGRPWRKGAVNIAVGVAGMSPFTHNSGKEDIYGYELRGSLVCLADQIASSAELVMGQADEGIPVVIVRGVDFEKDDGSASKIVRSDSENLF